MSCNCKRPRVARAVVPALVLALVPKCPLCIVAYASTLGLGISLSTATAARHAVIATCLVILGAMLARTIGPRRPTAEHRRRRETT